MSKRTLDAPFPPLRQQAQHVARALLASYPELDMRINYPLLEGQPPNYQSAFCVYKMQEGFLARCDAEEIALLLGGIPHVARDLFANNYEAHMVILLHAPSEWLDAIRYTAADVTPVTAVAEIARLAVKIGIFKALAGLMHAGRASAAP